MDTQHRTAVMWYGRLEGLLARHWPEVTGRGGLKISSATLLSALQHYGGPAALAADAQAAGRLARWGGARLAPEKIARLVGEAELRAARLSCHTSVVNSAKAPGWSVFCHAAKHEPDSQARETLVSASSSQARRASV